MQWLYILLSNEIPTGYAIDSQKHHLPGFCGLDDIFMKSGIISAAVLLAGLWFYSFKKLTIAACIFGAGIICFKVLTL